MSPVYAILQVLKLFARNTRNYTDFSVFELSTLRPSAANTTCNALVLEMIHVCLSLISRSNIIVFVCHFLSTSVNEISPRFVLKKVDYRSSSIG